MPLTDTFDYSLARWEMSVSSSTTFKAHLDIPNEDQINAGNWDRYPPIQAFLAWAEAARDGGTAITQVYSFGLSNLAEFEVSVDGTTYRFDIKSSFSIFDGITGYATSLDLTLTHVSGTPTIGAFTHYLRNETGTIPVDGRPLQEARVGNPKFLLRGSGIIGEEGSLLLHADGITLIDHDGRYHTVGAQHGGNLDYGDLEDTDFSVGSGDSVNQVYGKLISKSRLYDSIHIRGEQSARTLTRFPNPRDLLRYDDENRLISIHNHASTERHHDIYDHTGTRMLFLRAGQRSVWRVLRNGDGTGEIVLHSADDRYALHAYPDRHLLFDNGTRVVTDGIDILLGFPDAAGGDIDGDAFTQGTDPPPSIFSTYDNLDTHLHGFLTMGMDGWIHIDCSLETDMDPSGTGTMPAGSRIQVHHYKIDSSTEAVFREPPHTSYSVIDEGENYVLIHRRYVRKGDWIWTSFFSPTGQSIGSSNLYVNGMNRTVSLTPEIIREDNPTS